MQTIFIQKKFKKGYWRHVMLDDSAMRKGYSDRMIAKATVARGSLSPRSRKVRQRGGPVMPLANAGGRQD